MKQTQNLPDKPKMLAIDNVVEQCDDCKAFLHDDNNFYPVEESIFIERVYRILKTHCPECNDVYFVGSYI